MNVLNRILVILALLATMIISAIAFVATGPVVQTLSAFFQQAENNLAAMSGPRVFLRLGGGLLVTLVIWVICAALLYLELRRPKARTIKVQKVSGGEAALTADSIAGRLEYNIDLLKDVVKAKPDIRNGRRGVKILLSVETSPEVDVPSKTEEIQQLTKEIVENRMGLQLDSVKVVMRHAPYPRKGLFGGHQEEPVYVPVEKQPAELESPKEEEPPVETGNESQSDQEADFWNEADEDENPPS